MNCDDFLFRMQECIDDRLPFESDLQLQEHAQQCESCRSQWTAWLQISAVVSPANVEEATLDIPSFSPRPRLGNSFVRVGVGLAVAALIMIVVVGSRQGELDSAGDPLLQPSSSVTGMSPMIEPEPPADPAVWWQDVQQRDWLATTIPTVRRVRDGVAPLGRSIIQAVAILTVGGGERHS